MARITYADRFNDLLAKDYLTDNDRRFAESLYTYYKRKKVLTAGRRRCFLNLEQRYAERPVTNDAVVARINGLCERMDAAPGSEWESNFAISLLQQAKAGRDLSERQFEILEKIESKWSDDALQARNDWTDNFTSEMAEKYRVMMEYYGKNGYYSNLTTAYKKDPSLIPTMENMGSISMPTIATRKTPPPVATRPAKASAGMTADRATPRMADAAKMAVSFCMAQTWPAPSLRTGISPRSCQNM